MMLAPLSDLTQFGQEHFGQARLGDRRRTKRLVQLADRLARHPAGSVPEKLRCPAAYQALCRLVNTPEVTHAAVLQTHRDRTLTLMRQHQGPVLLIHDSTELDYTTKRSLTDLGQIGNGGGRGYICHNSLAVAPDRGLVLGLAHQILHRRVQAPKGEKIAARRNRDTRESLLWGQATRAIGAAPDGALWVDICDRGGDTFEFLDSQHQRHRSYVVRSNYDRQIEVGPVDDPTRTRLHGYARGLPEQGRRSVAVPARDGQPARTATVAVAWAAVRLLPPRQNRGQHRRGPLAVWVLRVWELEAPADVEPLEWLLVTNVAVETLEQAEQRITWYECRWTVEDFHKTQKTGCQIEAPQFTTTERLEPVIALLSVTAVLLLQLRSASRQADAAVRPATEVVPEAYVAVLFTWRHQERRRDWTVQEFFQALARLGGHQNRRHDGPPGWITLWRGWTKLQMMVEYAVAAGVEKCD